MARWAVEVEASTSAANPTNQQAGTNQAGSSAADCGLIFTSGLIFTIFSKFFMALMS
jgi:hypothetical protein